ncbi:MAG: hypothetical protein K9N62_18385, partial [Verrucomicrobia bacterium]|nr:hypothetical protein [Verrucomicrobiota bacterium]
GGFGSRVAKRLSGGASPYRHSNGRGGKVARTVPVSEGGFGSRVAKRLSEDASPYRHWNGRGGKVARTVPVSGPSVSPYEDPRLTGDGSPHLQTCSLQSRFYLALFSTRWKSGRNTAIAEAFWHAPLLPLVARNFPLES